MNRQELLRMAILLNIAALVNLASKQRVSYRVRLLACIIVASGSTAQAQLVWDGWLPSQHAYGMGFNGSNPSVAVWSSRVVEVHNGGNTAGPMWYHVGQRTDDFTVSWGSSYEYDNGFNPTVAIYGSTVVEVHNGGNTAGPMWYRVGTVTVGPIKWGPSYQYDYGFNPSVALTLDSGGLGLVAVEVHNGGTTAGPMWYHVGKVVGSIIEWGPSYQYDYGFNPSVAIQPYCLTFRSCGITAIEVHNGGDTPGPMWYRVGYWSRGFPHTIGWGDSVQYDHGWNPKVAVSSRSILTPPGVGVNAAGPVLEVHNGEAGAMWSHLGRLYLGYLYSSLDMGPPKQYDVGWNPSVAMDYDAETAVEVHDGFDTAGAMWFHSARFVRLR